MRKYQPSLRLSMAVSFGLLLLTCIVFLSIAIEEVAAQRIRYSAEQTLTILARQMADDLDHSLFERYREINLLAKMYPVLSVATVKQSEQRKLLDALQRSYTNYAWIGLTDPRGKVLAATDGLLEEDDVSMRPWFQEGLQEAYVGDLHEAMLLANLLPLATMPDGGPWGFVDIAAPVTDASGNVVGVLGAYLSWAWAAELQQALLPPETASQGIEIVVVSKEGNVLLGPPSLVGTVVSAELINTIDMAGQTAIVDWPDGSSQLTSHLQTQGYLDYSGLEWSVLVRQPAEISFLLIQQLRRRSFLVGLPFVLIGMLAVWLISGRLTKQLTAITNAATQIDAGASDVTIPLLGGNREVAMLSQVLNQLITELTTATTAERNRIARELHDSVTQTLFSSSMLADVLPKVWEANPELGKTKLEDLRIAVRGALAEMRTLLLELRPAAVMDTDWPRLLRQLAEATKGRAGVDVDWSIDGDFELPENVKLTFYRVAQESLNNVAKYANATHATVKLTCKESEVIMMIRDNGQGFELDATNGSHFGLTMMNERVEAVAGKLSIESSLDEGTIVLAQWQPPR